MSTEKTKKITPTKLKLKGLKFYFAPSIEKKLLDKMSNALLKCGSKIESFLDKSIHFLIVTNTSSRSPGNRSFTSKSPSSCLASPKLLSPYSSLKSPSPNLLATNQSTVWRSPGKKRNVDKLKKMLSSSNSQNNKVNVKNRFAFLREKKLQQQQQKAEKRRSDGSKEAETEKILETAKNMGVKVVTLQKVMSWLPQECFKGNINPRKPPTYLNANPNDEIIKIHKPCIKLDDGKHKPSYEDNFSQPYFNIKSKKIKSGTDGQPPQVVVRSSGFSYKEKQYELRQTKQKRGYCERCEVCYLNQSQHLKSEEHKKYNENEENFTELINYIENNNLGTQSFLSRFKISTETPEEQVEEDEAVDQPTTPTSNYGDSSFHPVTPLTGDVSIIGSSELHRIIASRKFDSTLDSDFC